MEGPTPQQLEIRIAALEERMKTQQAEYKTDIAMLGKQIAECDAQFAERQNAQTKWIIGFILGAAAIAIAIIRFFPA